MKIFEATPIDDVLCRYGNLKDLGYCLMTKRTHPLFLLLTFFVFSVLSLSAVTASPTPEITSQGFSAAEQQVGVIGKFPRLRVRIEVPEGLKVLRMQERSYDVDLAATRDRENLQLFGLVQPPRLSHDVTLNLQNYINEKLHSKGAYVFHILVTDRNNITVEKEMLIEVQEAVPDEKPAVDNEKRLLQSLPFSLQRTGAGPVMNGNLFGLQWKNTDTKYVAIKVTTSEKYNTRFVRLDQKYFDGLETIDQLTQVIADHEETEAVVLVTSGNKAADQVFSVRRGHKLYLLKVVESSAYPSAEGTKVILSGYYKHYGTSE